MAKTSKRSKMPKALYVVRDSYGSVLYASSKLNDLADYIDGDAFTVGIYNRVETRKGRMNTIVLE